MKSDFEKYKISVSEAGQIANRYYGVEGEIKVLPGDSDYNFKIKSSDKSYILKVSRPGTEREALLFQLELLIHLKGNKKICSPGPYLDLSGELLVEYRDKEGEIRFVRMLEWVEGDPWALVNPILDPQLLDLGRKAGALTNELQSFSHKASKRYFEWDIAQSLWTADHLHLFNEEERTIIVYFQDEFRRIFKNYAALRKSIVHNDVNNYNILLDPDPLNRNVVAIIDFGDALYTQTINDLAIALAYGIMDQKDPLSASLHIVKGYHQSFALKDEELKILYILVAMRLVVSICKSTQNAIKEADNTYHQISRKPAWKALRKWREINLNLAYYSFRSVCAFSPHPDNELFREWAADQKCSVADLLPDTKGQAVHHLDLGLSSSFLGHRSSFEVLETLAFKLHKLSKENNGALLAGGYKEIRPFYTTDAFKAEGNAGTQHRTAHLGIDLWLPAESRVHSLFDGKVVAIHNNDYPLDYGPTLIIQHKGVNGPQFFTLYGHLSLESLKHLKPGDSIKKGDLIGRIGHEKENGAWVPHLHFQLMLDLLGYEHDFPGVAFPGQLSVMSSVCPDPNLLFKEKKLNVKTDIEIQALEEQRLKNLGKSLSLSYDSPLLIVRGEGVHLIDHSGRKYLDTINNVAHVGHEHPRVVAAGQQQMAILNTNTRYLHPKINEFAEELLLTFPEELSVVHFVNSGSEANELALRMAKAYTGEKDVIAIEVGYHGNTNACIDISSYKFEGKGGHGLPEYTQVVPLPDSYRGLYRGSHTTSKYLNHLRESIERVKDKGRNIAAFIAESIISCGGQIELPSDYLKQTYGLVRAEGGLCIADEVQVGCGRVGKHFWAFQLHGVVPDIVTVGKPIGNGHPLAAVVCSREVADRFENGMEYFNTFGGNPVSCSIGLEVLRVIQSEKLQENAMKTGSYFKSRLVKLQKHFPIIGDVRGQGLFLGFELTGFDKVPLPGRASYLVNRMKMLGVLMSTDGKELNVIKIKPPIIFNHSHVDEVIEKLEHVMDEDYMKNY